MESIKLRTATRDDLPKLWEIILALKFAKQDGYFESAMEQQKAGVRDIFIASIDGVDVGYGMLAWEPKYVFFRKLNIPEIQDLNVLHDYRRRGVASAMIEHCEGLARKAGKEHMGIGVGMDASYGAAQQLYVRRGYVPDGNGLTYDRKPIAHGELRPIDDDISLMLVKAL